MNQDSQILQLFGGPAKCVIFQEDPEAYRFRFEFGRNYLDKSRGQVCKGLIEYTVRILQKKSLTSMVARALNANVEVKNSSRLSYVLPHSPSTTQVLKISSSCYKITYKTALIDHSRWEGPQCKIVHCDPCHWCEKRHVHFYTNTSIKFYIIYVFVQLTTRQQKPTDHHCRVKRNAERCSMITR